VGFFDSREFERTCTPRGNQEGPQRIFGNKRFGAHVCHSCKVYDGSEVVPTWMTPQKTFFFGDVSYSLEFRRSASFYRSSASHEIRSGAVQ